MPHSRKFNAVVLGAGGVGKSALAIRFHRNVFIEQYNPTIEEEYRCDFSVDGQPCTLDILDTPGIEQFTALNEHYLMDSRGFLLVFSLTDESSLKDVDRVLQQIHQIKGTDKDIPIVVVGTKLDLSNERTIPRATIRNLAVQWSLPFYETSAKKNWHVTEVFEDLVRQMRKRYPDDPASRRKQKDTCLLM